MDGGSFIERNAEHKQEAASRRSHTHVSFLPTANGAWSCWSSWSQCSSGCGGGHYQRTRSCASPPPANGGDICLGLHTEEALCNTHPCDGRFPATNGDPPAPGPFQWEPEASDSIISLLLCGFFRHVLMKRAGCGCLRSKQSC